VALEWVTREDHELTAEALLVADRRRLSLVDCVSFEVMRRLDIRECLAFDQHFAEQGFSPVNPPASAAPQESRVQLGDAGVRGGVLSCKSVPLQCVTLVCTIEVTIGGTP
jgi:hypothetical protein